MARKSEVLSLRFNQDQGCFMCCMDTGVRIYNVDPLVESAHIDNSITGSIANGEMLWRTNVIAIVGGGSKPKFADNTVLLYDDMTKKFVMEITFNNPVKAVRLRRDRIIVALEREIHVFSFPHPIRRILTLETRSNPKGILEVSTLTSGYKQLLVFPGHKLGSIQVVDLAQTETGISNSPQTIKAHENAIVCLAINVTGTKIASASERGTIIRIWCGINRTKLCNLRRGHDPATLYCLRFSNNSEFLVLSSDKGTIHIYAIEDISLNRSLPLGHFKVLGDYGENLWSYSNFVIPSECACICAFGEAPNTVIAACLNGSFYRAKFAKNKAVILDYDNFLDICDDKF